MSNEHVFAFVQQLADDLNSRKLSLPSFPDVGMRVRMAVNDENCTAEKLAVVVAPEVKLAASLLKVANSAKFSRGGKNLVDLPAAISRIGMEMVRNTAMAVAIQQLRLQKDYEEIDADLDALWQHSVKVATYAYVLARSQKGLNADTALLAGMMHGIGKIYVWSRASKNTELFSDKETIDELVASWHTSVGKSILESWGLPDEVAAAAENYLDFEEAASCEHARMVAIIAVANRLALNEGEDAAIESIGETPEYRRLQLSDDNPTAFVAANEEEIGEMRVALSA